MEIKNMFLKTGKSKLRWQENHVLKNRNSGRRDRKKCVLKNKIPHWAGAGKNQFSKTGKSRC